jgi:probable F420-dependent oxidoreductase
MKVDTGLPMRPDIDAIATYAAAQEAAGFSGVWSSETSHEPFLALVAAAQASTTVELGTSIAVAFARNPMNLANIGWDLQAMSRGRFILGLGSQVKPHITKRFSMEWSSPAARMREMVLALHAIWDTWLTGAPLRFDGEFYTHTLMTPYFVPDADDIAEWGPPRIHLAGVGERMTAVAGEVADGFLCHGFSTERYVREVTIPALTKARAAAGKTMEGFEIHGPMFLVTGAGEEEITRGIVAMREQIAFYASTPAYRAVLELHGWGDLQSELNALSKQGRWQEMGTLVDDDVLDAFAVVGEPDAIVPELARRYGDIVDRMHFRAPASLPAEQQASMIAALAAI